MRTFNLYYLRCVPLSSSMPSRGLTFHQEIQDAVAARERLVLVVGPRAALSDYVRQQWQLAIQAGKAVTPILRQGDYPLVPERRVFASGPERYLSIYFITEERLRVP